MTFFLVFIKISGYDRLGVYDFIFFLAVHSEFLKGYLLADEVVWISLRREPRLLKLNDFNELLSSI